jgi:peptidoglycan-N-acetylglucosamine deacetylase
MIALPGTGGKPVPIPAARPESFAEDDVLRSLLVALLLWASMPVLQDGPSAGEAVPAGLVRAAARYAGEPLDLRAAPALPPVPPAVVSHGSRRERLVALTFDACATGKSSGFDAGIVDALVATRTPATLFLGGKWMLEHPEATRRLAAEGLFEIGNHGFLHRHLPQLDDEAVRHELSWTQTVMFSLTGRQGTLVRAPYVELDERVIRLSAAMGLTPVQCDLPAGDPDPAPSAERLRQHVVASARNGSVVVMHINGRGWRTAEALPGIIAGLRNRGFELVTVGELLRRGAPGAATPP